MNGSRIIYAGPSKWFTRADNDCIPESNYAIYSVFGTNFENEVSNLNDDLDHEVVDLVDADEVLKRSLELIETPDTELDICVKLIDCENVSENTHFSQPDLELDLIDFRDSSKPKHKPINFSKFETKIIDFSDTELKLDYTQKPKETEFEMPLGIYIEEFKINTGVGIFTGNFFNLSLSWAG